MSLRIKDLVWLKQSFLLPESSIKDQDMVRRVLTTASYKFTDTTIGGNFAINPPPQFTRYADIKVGGDSAITYQRSVGEFLGRQNVISSGRTANFSQSRGQGRVYSEALDDHGQHVVMRFGVPEFNSLTMFFGQFYDPAASLLARTGRSTGLFFEAGRAVGFLLALPFQPLIIGGRIVRYLANIPPSKYYYLKPTMALYWNAVNTIVNGIGVNMGIVPRALSEGQKKVYGNVEEFGPGEYQRYHEMMPDIISPTGAIDVYALGTRAQRIANQYNLRLLEKLDQVTDAASLRQRMTEFQNELQNGAVADPGSSGADVYIKAYLNLAQARPKSVDAQGNIADTQEVEAVGDRTQYNGFVDGVKATIKNVAMNPIRNLANAASWGSSFAEFFEGERRDGASFVTFRVDYSGTASESFSNTSRESDIAQKINSASSQARSMRFNFAEGNIGDNAIAGLVESALSSVRDFATGVASQVQLSGLAALAGSAFVDIPKVWDSSTANLPRADYTIELRSPYGNKLSRMRNLYIPLAMLLAGALPLSAGKRAFTSPFICEAYCPGRVAIRTGMIDSLSITRGTGNTGWTPDGEPLGIDVSFSIVDFSSILHMPISANFGAIDAAVLGVGSQVGGALGGNAGATVGQDFASALLPSTYDDDNSFTDYLAVLGSLGYAEMVYASRRWHLQRMRQIRNYESFTSPARAASWFFSTIPGRVINAISLETDRP